MPSAFPAAAALYEDGVGYGTDDVRMGNVRTCGSVRMEIKGTFGGAHPH